MAGATCIRGLLYASFLISKFGAGLFFKFFGEVLLNFFQNFSHILVVFDGGYYSNSSCLNLAKIEPKMPIFGSNLGRGGHIASTMSEWWFLHQNQTHTCILIHIFRIACEAIFGWLLRLQEGASSNPIHVLSSISQLSYHLTLVLQ